MIRKILCILFVVFAFGNTYAQNGAIKGKILDGETGEAIPFANVVVEQNGNQIGGGVSDFDGNYTVKPVPAGKFTVKASYVGYNSLQVNDVLVYNDKVRFLDLNMSSSTQQLEEIDIVAFANPLIDKDNTTTGGVVTSEEISKMAGRSAESVASTVGGVYQEDGQVKSVRGAREGATVYYIDGVKVRGSKSLPKSSIAEVSVVTGGVPAKYGDATGGIISITTKGASRTFFGGLELATSKFLDPYENTIVGLNVSGPILKRKIIDPDNFEVIREEPLLGFFAAGEYDYALDPHPSAVGFWKVKDNILDSITRTPLFVEGDAISGKPTAAFLTKNDFENVDVRENVASTRASLSAKLDFQPVKNVVLTVGGTVQYYKGNQLNSNFYASTSQQYLSGAASQGLLNYNNNREIKENTYRGYARLTHRIGGSNDDDESASIIKNAYYQIQADYSKYLYTRQDEKHKDNFFNYGYVGKFTSYKNESYQLGLDTTVNKFGYLLTGYYDTLVTFQPSDINPELSKYTEWYYNEYGNPAMKGDIQGANALLNGYYPTDIYGMVNAPGASEQYYVKQDNDQFRFIASGAADINDHEISMGFEFEKRTDRYYQLEPEKLWLLASLNMNSHLADLDLGNPIVGYLYDENGELIEDQNGKPIFNDTIKYNRNYNSFTQSQFDIKFRKANGFSKTGTEFVDIDSFDPEKLQMEYFCPDELFYDGNSSLVSYYGYDAWGNKMASNEYPTFDEFFTDTYSYEGRQWYSRSVAPFEPIYMAGYIQDKFAFNDLVFNIGVRIDRYDANQKVQKDPYLVYTAYTVEDNQGIIADTKVPANINKEAVVYVNNESDPTEIKGYRYESEWYDAAGNQINNPKLLYDNGSIHPYLINPEDRVGESSFLDAFEDYEPDISIMPRISFSFPISDEALFFAHYDILTIRPSSGASRIDPFNYLYINQFGSRYFANPGLTSEKTIDYEFGFQQKLNNKSSIKLSTFYREQRDMVQVIQLLGAFPHDMRTYGNIDFGTIKGFTGTYDLRRTGNVQFKASYTLQFANATGSDATTALSLISAGQPNIRTTLPTTFDQRHTLSVLVDYRFGSGKNYNGPKWFGNDVLAEAGCNFTVSSGAGTPYTVKDVNDGSVLGSINGSQKPWRTTIGMKVDKSFAITMGKGEDAKKAELNVYLDVANLFNTRNILEVYETTGNPDDDAYLTSAKGAGVVSSALNSQSYVDYYTIMLNNGSNYNLPRQIRLGVLFSF
ncbi:MAG: carboxypeptidase-like regulatory domain-containing protein [Salinivirgaceae bacterium]|nr:carboxypeptidase-like regulatory domain-containing protein [Salinivirgaceae bacterium]